MRRLLPKIVNGKWQKREFSNLLVQFFLQGIVIIISENRQNTMSEWVFGLRTFIQNTTKRTVRARGLL